MNGVGSGREHSLSVYRAAGVGLLGGRGRSGRGSSWRGEDDEPRHPGRAHSSEKPRGEPHWRRRQSSATPVARQDGGGDATPALKRPG